MESFVFGSTDCERNKDGMDRSCFTYIAEANIFQARGGDCTRPIFFILYMCWIRDCFIFVYGYSYSK